MARIILFGGSFDPIHLGHLILAQAALEECRADGVLFVPAQISPHKTDRPITPGQHRARMISHAIRGQPQFALSTVELKRDPPSYTWDTVDYLQKKEPQDKFVLLLGWDQLAGLGTWFRGEELLHRVDVAVLPRGTGSNATITRPAQLTIKTWRKLRAAVLATPRIDISATAIRSRVTRGLSIRYLVPEAVQRYIMRERLYQPPALQPPHQNHR